MRTCHAKGFLALMLLLALPGEARSSGSPSPMELIQTAFDRMLNYSSARSVTFHIQRGDRRVTRRSFDVVYGRLGGRGHTLLRFTAPDYLRDSSILLVERKDGTSDTWLYRPSDRRPRRISTSQKADSFFGSDFSFEDLEHHDWRRFDLERISDSETQGRLAARVRAVPRGRSAYSAMVAWIDAEDMALLRVDFYRGGGSLPVKSLRVPRESLSRRDGVFLPEEMIMKQIGREAETRVEFHRIEVDPEVSEKTFSMTRLERSGQSLFDMVFPAMNENNE